MASWSTSPTSATSADDLLLFANYNQALPNNAAGTLSLQARRPIPEYSDITYAFNGGKSRYKAFQVKVEWRVRTNVTILSSLTLSEAKDNGAGSLENPNGNFPRRRTSTISTPTSALGVPPTVQQHDQCRVVAAVRSRPQWRPPRLDAIIGGWQLAAINQCQRR
ncbi:MAG: hypothetical protein QM736_12175 [Vicinamibacterales bacterium]